MQRLRFVLIAIPFAFLACGGSDAASVFAEPPGGASDTGTATTTETGEPVDSSSIEPDGSVVVEDTAKPPPADSGAVDSGVVLPDSPPPPIDSGVAMDTASPPGDTGVAMDTASPPGDTGVTCTDPGGKLYAGHCYFPTTITRFWQNARDLCVTSGAHLVTITSAGEQSVVESISSGDRWIGMARFEGSSMYRWLNGEPTTYTRWAPGEPNGSGACVRLRADGQWADFGCSTNYTGICERE